MQLIVGCSGKAGSGKGVFASVARDALGAQIISFASGVKEEVATFLGMCGVAYEPRHLYGSQEDKEELLFIFKDSYPEYFIDFIRKVAKRSGQGYSFPARGLLQWHGTEFRRSQDENYWVKLAFAKMKDLNKLYVIDDCRFSSEAYAIQQRQGVLVRVKRTGGPIISNTQHPSETGLDYWDLWDYVIKNDSDLLSYRAACLNVLRHIVGYDGE